MDFRPSEDHAAIRGAVREMMRAFPDAYWSEHDETHTYPEEFYRAFADAGFLGTAIPEALGGSGLGIVEAGLVLMEVAASGAAMNGASAVHIGMFGINPVVKHGTDAMRSAHVPHVVSGDTRVCLSVSEPDLGTDVSNIRTRAVRDGDGYVITGRKTWLTTASESHRVLILTRTAPRAREGNPYHGLTMFFSELRHAELDIRPIRKMGRNAVTTNEVVFDGYRVPASDMVGEEGRAFKLLLDGLNPERILVAFEAIGVGRAALAKAVTYTKDRTVFGRAIGSNQAVQFPLTDAAMRLDAAELMAMKAGWLYDNGLPCGPEASMAKFLAAEAGFMAADRAMQAMGGYGYASEFHVERYFREARLLRITPISENMILSYLGEQVLGMPKTY
ncbi:acyl-CoA dehydrogenase [Pseudooceanicola sp. 216_PA32_1]|uniref:Acyl-CoA dehydrogenase n=1 Tax=Pseudooceanicola pacificus TaxID=2676438 RepID=A0A844W2T7_9RHOB|nr:acyl-CoA dehydrogenase family protein [Pseudooceanicola pacificus]MWB78097.1 acyl-CoA dehydrogenase [Pseudooceanicola pacificus]